jgi:hypothetical protein
MIITNPALDAGSRPGKAGQTYEPPATSGGFFLSDAALPPVRADTNATLPAATAAASDLKFPLRSRTGNGWPLQRISHSHEAWPRRATMTWYMSAPGGQTMVVVCHALDAREYLL